MNDAKEFCQILLRVKRVNKMIGTYYDRLKDRTYPEGVIRGYLNHCSTQTGRLTSDLQQMPSRRLSKVKQMFTSRFK
jgi:DNA polymerase I-like protein with 3'-5' exonuclease and polymerase domains